MTAWKLFALGSALFAGLTAILAKIGVENIPSNLATFIRTIVILLFLAMLLMLRGEWQNPMQYSSKSLVFLVLSGITTGLSWICYYRALQLGPASLVSPLDKLSLPVAVVLSVLLLGEKLNVVQWLGAGLMTFGALLLALK